MQNKIFEFISSEVTEHDYVDFVQCLFICVRLVHIFTEV